ncbi:MAG: hypothetical protein ACTSRZ_19975 [Promethearchaeota archaeon]
MNIKDIYVNPNNPRYIKDERYQKLKKSIKEFPKMMKLRPIIVDDKGMILGGNMRYLAMVDLGYKEIPEGWVVKASELTKEEKKRFIIADNLPFGDFDYDKLANEWDLEELQDWGMELPEFPEIIENENYELSQNPNDIYGGNSIMVRIGDFIAYIKKNKDITDYLDEFVSKFDLKDEKEAQGKRNKTGLKIIELIKKNEDSLL